MQNYYRKILQLNFKETYIRDIIQKNIDEIEALLDILSSAIGSLTNPNKLQKTFKNVNKSKITTTTITKYIEYLEDSFLIKEAKRYDIKGKAYIKTPLKIILWIWGFVMQEFNLDKWKSLILWIM